MGYPTIFGVTGYARHGKNTVADIIGQEKEGVRVVGFADALRDMAQSIGSFVDVGGMTYTDALNKYGYDDAKNLPAFRAFLQVLGTKGVRDVLGPDAWIQALDRKVQTMDGLVVVTDVRFENEVDYIKEHGTLIAVTRENPDGSEFDNGVSKEHPSEAYIVTARERADFKLTASSVEQLEGRVRMMLDVYYHMYLPA